MWSTSKLFKRESVVVDLKYVLTLFNAENERSLIAFAARITNISFAIFTTSVRTAHFKLSKLYRKEIKSVMVNDFLS